jgi:hypothetical protein
MENDDKPGLRLVPSTPEAIEAEVEPSNVRVLHPVPPELAALERKHQAHLEAVQGKHEADMRADSLARQLADYERRHAEGVSIGAELEKPGMSKPLMERYFQWFEENPLECLLITSAVLYAAYQFGVWVWNTAVATQKPAMQRELNRALGELRARAQLDGQQLRASAREYLQANGEVHNHNTTRNVTETHHHHTTQVIEKAKWRTPKQGPQGPRGPAPTEKQIDAAVTKYLSRAGVRVEI